MSDIQKIPVLIVYERNGNTMVLKDITDLVSSVGQITYLL